MHVGIVGAGISGLYSALLLRREGHKVTIFEASDRVGGRIYTYRFAPQSRSEDVYFEAGAMRIPRSSLHSQVFDLIRYLNTHSRTGDKIELIPYVLEHENNMSFFQNQKGRLADERWAAKAALPIEYRNKSPQELLGSVVLPWLTHLRRDFDGGFEKLMQYDEYSFRAYLRSVVGWPHEVIEFVELFCSQTNQYDLAFTEIIMQNLDFDTKDWATVRDGMSRLTQSAAMLVGSNNIRLNSRVDRIAYLSDGRVELSAQGLHQTHHPTEVFDAVIIATPPSALHSIVDRPRWSFMKEQAIRGAHYEPLYKIGLHFRTRFWERSTLTPCFGGQSTTDLRFRWIVFPSNDLGGNGSGVLLLYSWMSDACKWAGLSREQRIKVCLHDLATYYADEPGVDVYDQYIAAFDVMWTAESAGGDAMFLPGQFTRFFEAARKPEGRIHGTEYPGRFLHSHLPACPALGRVNLWKLGTDIRCLYKFAGEHLSKHHTWIAGAIDSALHTTANLIGCTVQGDSHDESDQDKGKPKKRAITALGREYLTTDAQRRVQKTDISSRRFKACVIPDHMNVQYVEVF